MSNIYVTIDYYNKEDDVYVLHFTHLSGGNHRATWFVAYGIEGVQDWLFEQHK